MSKIQDVLRGDLHLSAQTQKAPRSLHFPFNFVFYWISLPLVLLCSATECAFL